MPLKSIGKAPQTAGLDPWEPKAPCQMAPHFGQQWVDVGVGATPQLTDQTIAVLPDNGLEYEIDDIGYVVAGEAIDDNSGNPATLKIGVHAPNGNEAASTALSDDDYFMAVANLADNAVLGSEVSVGAGGISFATTADSVPKRRIRGPAVVTATTTAGSGGGQTGQISVYCRYHVSGNGKLHTYGLIDEPADAQ